MAPLSCLNDFQMVSCSKSSHVPLAPTRACSPGQTLPPQAHGHPGGAVLGRQLPPQLSAARLAVPAGSSGATREDFSKIFSKNLIFAVARQGEFFSLRVGSQEEHCLPCSQRSPRGAEGHLPFTSFRCIFSCPWVSPESPLGPLAPSTSAAGVPRQAPAVLRGSPGRVRAPLSPPQPGSTAHPSKAEANKRFPR